MHFQALDLSLDMIRSVRDPLTRIQQHDANLVKQLRAAAASVPLNLSEGRRRVGKDRLHSWRIAAGSADEARTCLLVAEAWGHVDHADIKAALALLDRLLAITWSLTH